MAIARTLFDDPHHQSLEILAAQALRSGDAASAFKFVDRRCRIEPPPEAHCHVLRGEALFQMGKRAAAIAELEKALEIAPEDISANRRILAWAGGRRRLRAAAALIGIERNFEVLAKAIEILRQEGQETFVRLTALENTIEGFVVWSNQDPIDITIDDGTDSISKLIVPDRRHPLAPMGSAADFRLPRLRSTRPQSIRLSLSGQVIHSARCAANETDRDGEKARSKKAVVRARQVTVVVPVYGDYPATKTCLDRLREEIAASEDHYAIIVDDATPDPRIAQYLSRISGDPRIELLINRQNLGFVGAINRALEQVTDGDVILLNSDTVVPRGFIDRLAAAARLSPDIGTVTPLSNNGEFTSFPICNTFNPLGSADEIARIDRLAARVNANRIIDIPSGIGFCLYITRACLEAVRFLSEDFHRGYLEDVDFCLRARAKGFRNVCAGSVYVGHAGSKSFGQEKRSLVVRNLKVLESRFPEHRAECAAFIMADPLRELRERIERLAVPHGTSPLLLVTGPGVVPAIAQARLHRLLSEHKSVLLVEIQPHSKLRQVSLSDASGTMPQSLRFDLSVASERRFLVDYLRKVKPRQIEILDPINLPKFFTRLLSRSRMAYDVFIAEGSYLGAGNETRPPASALRDGGEELYPGRTSERVASEGKTRMQIARAIAGRAERLLAPSPEAEALAMRHMPETKIARVDKRIPRPRVTRTKAGRSGAARLGIIPLSPSLREQNFVTEIVQNLAAMRADIMVTVLGASLDDLRLMRASNIFVTGAVGADEFIDLYESYGLQFIFLSARRPIFGHPLQELAAGSSLPLAYFDWSGGQVKPRRGDLALETDLPSGKTAAAIARWLPCDAFRS